MEGRYNFFTIESDYEQAKHSIRELVRMNLIDATTSAALMKNLEDTFQRLVRKWDNHVKFNKSLVGQLPPPLNRRNVRGIVAFREWNVVADTPSNGTLRPLILGMRVEWKPVMFADKVPTPNNSNGLYARTLHPSCIEINYVGGDVFGFVELLGHIEEHNDGVYRAEMARILSIYIPVNSSNDEMLALGMLDSIMREYSNIPVYPVSHAQSKLIIMREILISCGVSTY